MPSGHVARRTGAAVPLSLQAVQALAPDQSALAAAGKLLNPKQWLLVASHAESRVIWGECQGSGANPYRVVADVADHGYKCSCPSRKFPCKHSLALMWQFAEDAGRFVEQDVPPWVQEWSGRRKRSPAQAVEGAARPVTDIVAARAAIETADSSAEDEDKRARAALRRRVQTDDAVRAGLHELAQWIADQLRGGVARMLDEAPQRCRRIAARLVDAKAAALASRLDELPSRVLALPAPLRAEALLQELGQLVLLMQAWRAAPDDDDARSYVVQVPDRDALLASARTLRIASDWRVVGQQVETRRDGLVAQSTWLQDERAGSPRFALLLDFFPTSAGRRAAAFAHGQVLSAELAFYPSRWPLRAVLVQTTASDAAPVADPSPSAAPEQADIDPLATHRVHLAHVPWALQTPLSLGAGRILQAPDGAIWWRSSDDASALRLAPLRQARLFGAVGCLAAVALWDGHRATLLSIDTPHGRADPDG